MARITPVHAIHLSQAKLEKVIDKINQILKNSLNKTSQAMAQSKRVS
jgi:hypothetical protein